MEVLFLIGLIVLNGALAMSEIALVTARRTRLARRAEEGDAAALMAIKLGEDPTRFLSTIQIGITSIGVLSGIVGEAALAQPLSDLLEVAGVNPHPAGIVATILVVVLITYVSIVVGELVPKRLGQIDPEGVARLVARPMHALSVTARPFVWLLSWSTGALLRLLGQRDQVGSRVTEDEIHALLLEGSQAGVIDASEHHMVRNVFRLDDRQMGSLMVPRGEIAWLDLNTPLEENLARIAGSVHSRFPVCRGGLDDVVGVAVMKHLFSQSLRGQGVDLAADLEPAVYVPESLTGMQLLGEFRANGAQMVFVIDEYGDLMGLVTLQDVLEAVTGEFQPRDPEDAWAVARADGSWLLDGLIPIMELKDRLSLKTVPEEDKGRYHTLSGMLLWLLGRVPQTGDLVDWEGWDLEIIDMDGRRIDKVLASPRPQPEAPGEPFA
ncbi:hemolysin family protein [uncultured Thiodictyon sp.]|jgi:putative hemolysin|uniref:hemolysin family protein n=1 Tax=uncultured Thiodictyon sp. TaxID=1846217 RepID=UPI0025D7AD73|nr:hemolysin family protein [uncultured Thiodictyon sp.]